MDTSIARRRKQGELTLIPAKKMLWKTLNGYVAFLIYIGEHNENTLEYWYQRLYQPVAKKHYKQHFLTRQVIQDIWDHKRYREITRLIVDDPDQMPRFPRTNPRLG